jgi:acyl dehydratase
VNTYSFSTIDERPGPPRSSLHHLKTREGKLLPKEGDTALITKRISLEEIKEFARLTGDTNPVHMDEEYAKKTRFKGIVAHGMWTASLVSAVLGTELPGPGTIYLSQWIKFKGPVYPGDDITAKVTVTKVDDEKPIVTLETSCLRQTGEVVLTGEAVALYEEI